MHDVLRFPTAVKHDPAMMIGCADSATICGGSSRLGLRVFGSAAAMCAS
jgi:hypothetical protein